MNTNEIVEALEQWLDARLEEQLSPCGKGANRRDMEEETKRRKEVFANELSRILEP